MVEMESGQDDPSSSMKRDSKRSSHTTSASETTCTRNCKINVDLDEATNNLPDPSTWKYRPLFIQAVGDTVCPGQKDSTTSLPIGTPFDFESKLFKGKILIRLRNHHGMTEEKQKSDAFFNSSKLRIQRQVTIQGTFKRPGVKMSELWFGDIYDTKLKMTPPRRVAQFMNKLFNKLSPGIILDLASDKPRVLSLLGSASDKLSIDKPGSEPDITSTLLPERTFMSQDTDGDTKSAERRKHTLGKPMTAAKYECDTDMVYTFHTIDEVLDIADYRLRLPILNFDFTKILGDGQPLSFRAVTKCTEDDDDDVESLFYFRIWHERTLINNLKSKD